jgi:hypothetical protein
MEGLVVPEHLRSPEKECDDPSCECSESPGGKAGALEKGDAVPKYQYGEGCLSDQLLGQYLAHVAGLGYILPHAHVDKAMKSIFNYNFLADLSRFSNVQRVYALNEEAGLLLCSWPKGKRPALPFVYSDEVWTGIEYQVAASLIYSGHIDEGLTIVKALRERYSGFNRNPWDELECGHHYARALASWAVLLALSGYQYDGTQSFMAFSPKMNEDGFSTFWSCGSGWGSFEIKERTAILKVEYGNLELSKFGMSEDYGFRSIRSIHVDSEKRAGQLKREKGLSVVHLEEPEKLGRGSRIEIVFQR